jgi:hypothetical protein
MVSSLSKTESVREIAVARIARLRDCKIAFADKLRDIMEGLNVEPQNPQRPAATMTLQQLLPVLLQKRLHQTTSGAQEFAGLDSLFSPNNTD